LFGVPVDDRLVRSAARQRAAFERAVTLLDRPGEEFGVALDGATIPGWFLPGGDGMRPLVLLTNGYDAGMPELLLSASAGLRRGYHVAIFDGPGQGRMLFEQRVPLRADWEAVVSPVLDALLGRPDVHPGLYGIREGMVARLEMLQVPESVLAQFPDIPADVLAPIEAFIDSSRFLTWTVKQRGFMTHGVDNVSGYLHAIDDFTLAGRLGDVRCPTLVTAAESDPLAGSAPQVVAEITGAPAELLRFTAEEGAGDHCEWRNRARFDQVAYDWLDVQLRAG